MTEGTGIKERLRLRLAEEGQWPVDVGLYGELVENEARARARGQDHPAATHRRSAASSRTSGGEREYENFSIHDGDWVINPTLGLTYQVTPVFHPGIEGWMRAEYPDSKPPRTFNLGPQVYVGPTMMFDFGNFWWSTGAYFRVTDVGRSPFDGDARTLTTPLAAGQAVPPPDAFRERLDPHDHRPEASEGRPVLPRALLGSVLRADDRVGLALLLVR